MPCQLSAGTLLAPGCLIRNDQRLHATKQFALRSPSVDYMCSTSKRRNPCPWLECLAPYGGNTHGTCQSVPEVLTSARRTIRGRCILLHSAAPASLVPQLKHAGVSQRRRFEYSPLKEKPCFSQRNASLEERKLLRQRWCFQKTNLSRL